MDFDVKSATSGFSQLFMVRAVGHPLLLQAIKDARSRHIGNFSMAPISECHD
jgi:hypothetical protein